MANKQNYSRTNKKGSRGKRGSNKFTKRQRDVESMDMKSTSKLLNNTTSSPNVMTGSKFDNDPSWYDNIGPLLKDVASLPFSLPNGLSFNPVNNDAVAGNLHRAYPGIMQIKLMPTIGKCKAPTDAANIAAQQLYTMVRKANSGAANYDRTDLMRVVIAMDSAYMLYEWALRAYRAAGTYNYMNRYLPEGVMNAIGCSPSVSSDLTRFRGILDLFAYRLASINIPNVFDFIKRHSWLFSNIYTDATDRKAQLYAFVPHGLYIWKEAEGGQPAYLEYNTMQTLTSTTDGYISSLDSLQTIINTVMEPLLGSEDVGNISGDIAKAFGEGEMIKIRPVEDYAFLEPVYSKEVLLQISNLTQVPPLANVSSSLNFNITNVLGNLAAGPYLSQDIPLQSTMEDYYLFIDTKPLLNFIDVETTPENVMVATRLTAAGEGTGSGMMLTHYGTEIVVGIKIYTNRVGDTNIPSLTNVQVETRLNTTTANSGTWNMINALTKFDWAPAVYLWNVTGTAPAVTRTLVGNLVDVCNYTYLENSTIRDLHSVAVMSEFAVSGYNYNA